MKLPMKKKSVFYNRGCPFGIKGAVAFSAFLAATAIAYGQNLWPRGTLTENVTGIMERVDYTIAAPDLVLIHKYDGARHYNATINLNGYSATFLADVHTSSPSTDFFAFGGATFKGTGADNVLDIGIVEGSQPIRLIAGGFTVDNATVNMDLGSGSTYVDTNTYVKVVNNGVLNWTNAIPNEYGNGKNLILTIGNGADDNARASITYAYKAWNTASNKITVNGGSFNFNVKGGRMQFVEMKVNSLSADSYIDTGLGINAGGVLEIGKDIDYKIKMGRNLVFYDNATYRSYTSDVVVSNTGYAKIEIAGAAKSINMDLHADHTFSVVMVNGDHAQMNLSLNGSVLTFESLDFTKLDVVIADFENGLFRWKDGTGFDASKISATWNGQILDDIEAVLNEKDGYTYLFSATVPEPAEVAVVFAALALAFALYRRRK